MNSFNLSSFVNVCETLSAMHRFSQRRSRWLSNVHSLSAHPKRKEKKKERRNWQAMIVLAHNGLFVFLIRRYGTIFEARFFGFGFSGPRNKALGQYGTF